MRRASPACRDRRARTVRWLMRASPPSPPTPTAPSLSRTWSTLGEGDPRGTFSRMWTPAAIPPPRSVSCHVERVQRVSVPYQQPRWVVVLRSESPDEILDRRRTRHDARPVPGGVRRGSPRRVSAFGGGAVREGCHQAVFVHGEPRPACLLVTAPEDPGARRPQDRDRGRWTVHALVAVCPHDQRRLLLDARDHHQQAHRGPR